MATHAWLLSTSSSSRHSKTFAITISLSRPDGEYLPQGLNGAVTDLLEDVYDAVAELVKVWRDFRRLGLACLPSGQDCYTCLQWIRWTIDSVGKSAMYCYMVVYISRIGQPP